MLVTDRIDRPVIRVRPQPATERDGWLRRSALVEGLAGEDVELWFDFEPQHVPLLTSRADPWPLALLFTAMHAGSALWVDGEVSRDLLTNLEAVQATWQLWVPDRYRPGELRATAEVRDPARSAHGTESALMVCDGGLDSYYTAWRHVRRLAGRLTLAIRAGLVVVGPPPRGARGVDPPVEQARALLGDLGLDLWTLRTNVASVVPVWEHASGTLLASCLHWFSGGVDVGVLPATGTLARLGVPAGSHPLTDPWLGSDRMRVVHDGAEVDYPVKVERLAAWPEATRRLRGPAGPSGLSVQRTPSSVARPGGPVPVPAGPPSGAAFVWAARPRASEIRVFPEPPVLVDGRVVLKARIEGLGARRRALWFSTDARHAPHVTWLADPFACALQLPALRAGAALVIHGPVSRTLLENLERFQQVWRAWAPAQVTPGPMRADREVEGVPSGVADSTLMLFSGGLDSSFSILRHHRGLVGRRSRRIAAALMVLGFDIPHAETREFGAALENSRRMLEGLGIDLWSMATNFRDVVRDWEPGHGTGIAAAAHCFGGHIGTALVAAQGTAASLGFGWGTHPLTDRLLSSDRLRVLTDGEDTGGRLDKVVLIATWPAAMRGLRVCYESARRDRNCGTCAKCVRTSLAFLANGLPLPSTLPPPDPERVSRLPLPAAWEVRAIRRLLARAQAVGVADRPEFLALSECLRWNDMRWTDPAAAHRVPLWRRARRRFTRTLRQWAG
jgi:hypothetical protein